jgi:hypothetical protein
VYILTVVIQKWKELIEQCFSICDAKITANCKLNLGVLYEEEKEETLM